MLESERGRLTPPDLDDRQWQDIVDEARALIPKYAPQWTDHNPADLGITLIELFAWIVEGLIYRLNQVPEKNYIAFLNLLGITRNPATPARTYLTFTAQPTGGPIQVPAGTQAQTAAREAETPVIFETDETISVLPINLRTVLRVSRQAGAALDSVENLSSAFVTVPTAGAVLDVAAGGAMNLCLGFDGRSQEILRLLLRLTHPALPAPPALAPEITVQWTYSAAAPAPSNWPVMPADRVADGTRRLAQDGHLTIQPPADWSGHPVAELGLPQAAGTAAPPAGTLFWLGLRIVNPTTAPIQIPFGAILFNTAIAHNALTVPAAVPENLGTGSGKPYQVFALRNWPLFQRPFPDVAVSDLVVQVAGVTWKRVEDYSPGDGLEYRVNTVTGEILFGNYDNRIGFGHIPPKDSPITASYRYVAGGASGNVGAGAITTLRASVAGIIGVTNLTSATGGQDEEPIEEMLRRAPNVLRNRDRAVTAEDYEFLARKASPEVAIVRCLPARLHTLAEAHDGIKENDPWTYAGLYRSPGSVYVIVAPRAGMDQVKPWPSATMLLAVQRYLDTRRDIAAQLHVVEPRYLPIEVHIEAYVWQHAITDGLFVSPAQFYDRLEARVKQFLHPVLGGPTGGGWQVGQSVSISDIYAFVHPSDQEGYISSLLIRPMLPDYHGPPLGPGGAWNDTERPRDPNGWKFGADGSAAPLGPRVAVLDYELICFGKIVMERKGAVQS